MNNYLKFTIRVGIIPKDYVDYFQDSTLYKHIADRIVTYLYNKKLNFEDNLKLITSVVYNQDFIQDIKLKNDLLSTESIQCVYSIDLRLDINDNIPRVEIRFCTTNFEGVIEFFKCNRHFQNSCCALLTKLNQDKYIDYCSSFRRL